MSHTKSEFECPKIMSGDIQKSYQVLLDHIIILSFCIASQMGNFLQIHHQTYQNKYFIAKPCSFIAHYCRALSKAKSLLEMATAECQSHMLFGRHYNESLM